MAYYKFEYGYRTRTEAIAIVQADNIDDAEDLFFESYNIPEDLYCYKFIDQETELMDGTQCFELATIKKDVKISNNEE